VAHWLRSYWFMLKWQALSKKPLLTITAAIEIAIALAVVIGMSFLFPEIDPLTARFLTTGAATIILLTIGIVLVPQIVAMGRTEGTFDYVWSLPVPRMVYLAADATIWVLLSLPGVVLALVIGAAYYDFGLQVSALVVPAVLVIAITGIFIGSAFSHAVPKPEMAHLISQVNIFFVLLFSPINYPIERLPGWFQAVHVGLPMKYMADLMRSTLTGADINLGLAFGVVTAWLVGGLLVTYVLVRRRR
jgi:ABC-2 type transport system permease protein